MSAQALDDLDAFCNGCAEVTGTLHKVALIQVIWAHTDAGKFLNQFTLHMNTVIYAGQKHGLISKRDAYASHAVTGFGQFFGNLIRVVDVNIQPQRMELGEHVAQFLGHTHRHEDRHTRPDAYNFNMRDLAQAGKQLFQDLGSQYEWITTGEQHVTHLRCVFEIFDLHLKILAVEGLPGIADDARARAITAVRGALSRYQHKHPVRIAVNQPWHGRVAILRKRIFHHGSESIHLLRYGNNLFADGVIGIIRVDQGDKVGCHIHTEQTLCLQSLAFRVGQRNHFFDVFSGVQAVT